MKFDVIIIGGGLAGVTAASALQEAGLRCAIVQFGESVRHPGTGSFHGHIFRGDKVTEGIFVKDRLTGVRTANFESAPLLADAFILATGKFVSGGLAADMEGVRETIFGLDCIFDTDRSRWFDRDFFAPQPFMEFGVRTDSSSRCFRSGQLITNLYAAGEIMAGGIDIVQSAVKAANEILNARVQQ